jgi:hypothetical protein
VGTGQTPPVPAALHHAQCHGNWNMLEAAPMRVSGASSRSAASSIGVFRGEAAPDYLRSTTTSIRRRLTEWRSG